MAEKYVQGMRSGGEGGRANKILIMDDASLESRIGTAEIANQCCCLPKGTRQAEGMKEEGRREGDTKLAIN